MKIGKKMLREAHLALDRAAESAAGYCELAQIALELGNTSSFDTLTQRAVDALADFGDNDDYIDALYDEDMRLMREQ